MQAFWRRITQARARDRRSAGFTLIELMVVIIIIGILAAIAVPVFLNQRQSAWDANTQTDLANFRISAAEYGLANNSNYTGMTVGVLTGSTYEFSPSSEDPPAQWTVSITGSGKSYTVTVFSNNYASPGTGHRYTFDSSTGAMTKS